MNKLSTEIIKNHDIICIEDLHTKGMLRNHKLAKAISDVSWSSFVRKLQYKADWYGRKLIKIESWWTCPSCHITHDRDINASKNTLTEGLRLHARTF